MVERLIGPLRVRRHGAAELAALAVFIAHASEIVLAQHVIVRDRLRIPDGLRVRLLSHIVVPLTGLIHRRRTMPPPPRRDTINYAVSGRFSGRNPTYVVEGLSGLQIRSSCIRKTLWITSRYDCFI